MRKLLLNTTFFVFLVMLITGCSKQDVTGPGETAGNVSQAVSTKSLETALLKSVEFATYVQATNAMLTMMMDPGNTAAAKGVTDCNYGAYSRAEATRLLSFTKDPVKLMGYMALQANAVKSFGETHQLDRKTNAAVWQKVANANPGLFTGQPGGAGLGASVQCLANAVTEFINTTIECLALRDIPLVGDELFQACQLTAILVATGAIQGCLGL